MFNNSVLRVVVGLALFVLLIRGTETVFEALLLPEWIIRLVTLGALAIGGVVLALYLYRRRGQENEGASPQRGAEKHCSQSRDDLEDQGHGVA